MAKGKPEYDGGTVVGVTRDGKGAVTSRVEADVNGNKWHVVEGQDAVLLRDESEVNAIVNVAG
jgi:hypothetical protein